VNDRRQALRDEIPQNYLDLWFVGWSLVLALILWLMVVRNWTRLEANVVQRKALLIIGTLAMLSVVVTLAAHIAG
jgi:hypothetical protein